MNTTEYYWISRTTDAGVEFLVADEGYVFGNCKWNKYLRLDRKIMSNLDGIVDLSERLEKQFPNDNIELYIFSENDPELKKTQLIYNNVGTAVFGNNLPKTNNEYCTLCRNGCKQPGFVFIELCPDFEAI